MNKNEIQRKMEEAVRIVKAWPEWKQNILAHSSKPTISVPRPPVNNQASDADRSGSAKK